ncbi:MAG: polysaccharide biosynthesis/export family protein [Paludibacter sp.]
MRKPLIQFLFAILLAFELTSCITTHQTNYLQASKNLSHKYKDSISYKDYRLKDDDKLFIQVYSTDAKTNGLFNGSGNTGMQMLMGSGSGESMDLYTYSVQTNGNIQFPVVGEIPVRGKTLRETKKIIEDAIRPILKVNSVNVRMVSRSFSVIGAGKSGRFSFPKEKINIFQALAISGDLGIYTDRSKIKILRQTKNGTLIKTFDIRGEDIINSEFYYLEPDDIIFLEPMNAKFFGVTTFWSAISTVITTVSFLTGIYAIATK